MDYTCALLESIVLSQCEKQKVVNIVHFNITVSYFFIILLPGPQYCHAKHKTRYLVHVNACECWFLTATELLCDQIVCGQSTFDLQG